MVNLSTTVRGTPTYNSGNAKFGSYGLSGGVISGNNVDSFLSSTGANGGSLNGTGTIEAWVKASSVSGRKVFLQHSGWWYLASDNGQLFLEWGWGSPLSISGGAIMDGNWHHVALVFNAGAPSIYVDGTRVATSGTVQPATGDGTTSGVFAVGGFVPATGFDWPGSVDEVRVSNVARYTGTSYTVPTAAFSPDASTVGLYHLENNGNDTWYQRTNLSKNPSFEVDLSGYTVEYGLTRTRDTTEFLFGTASMKCVEGGGANTIVLYGAATSDGLAPDTAMPVTAGQRVFHSFYVKQPTTTSTLTLAIKWYNAAGAYIGVNQIANQATGTSWTRLSTSAVAPANAAKFGVTIYANNAFTGYFDGFMPEVADTLGTYFDGSTVNAGYTYAWTGTANASTSTETAASAPAPKTISSALSGTGTLSSTATYTKRITSSFSGTGTLGSKLVRNIASPLSGTGSLASKLTGYQRISSGLSGSGTLTSVMGRILHADYSGTGTLTSALHRYIKSDLNGSGTLTSRLTGYRKIASALSSEGGLSSTLTGGNLGKQISSVLSGSGTLVSRINGQRKQITSALGSEGVLYSELAYVTQPQPLAELPLGKLARFTINNYAVPLNPADGSGSTPSVNATYIKGKNPEFALGEDFTVDNGAVGRYTGEIVRLSLNKKSDVATISTDTLLTKTNVEKHLYPFIDTDPGLWTAARAIDYWTQQCGAMYDAVDGEVSMYASGFGHTNGFALGIEDSHFYDKVTAGAVSTTVLNGRTVTSFGSAATTVMAQHEAKQTRVPITVSQARKMVFSFGVAVRGTGRTASVTYNFIDGSEHTHAVRIEVTSAGVVTAKVVGTTVHTLTAPGPGTYRVSFSIQRMSPTAMAGKLTLHADDLDGSGALLVNSPVKVFGSTLPGTLWLMSVDHASTGGSGAEMLRWGTCLAVAKYHPMTLPAVQKELGQSKKPLAYVSGFSGNVWKMLNEFCSINRLDVSFLDDRLVLGPRASTFSGSVKFSDFTMDMERREKYKQVAVVNKRSKAVTTGDAVFWRADSVFQVAAREVFETTVQTGHSILNLSQPQAVTGIMPFPYKQGTGQYVVTGADGYIIAPQWWADNGGKVEVSMTEKEGEIAIKITAPTLDTVRAPYRISEGEGDRPALYISGSGIMNDPTELHIATGAKNAREGFDNVFESPFIATTADAFNTAARMAMQYNAAMADVSYEVDNSFGVPSDLGTYPAGMVFTDNDRNYKITDASQTHSKTTGGAIPFTSIAAYNASFPEGATIADEKARHFGRTIKQVNIKPLRSNDA